MKGVQLFLGDCLDSLKKLEDDSVDSVVTDPPYGLSFMGNKWDYDVPSKEIWEECLRVLKPGGYLLSFSSSRTYHRMAIAVEDAGFEIRDQIMWVYGSGFPKSQNIGKKVEKFGGWGTALKPAHEPIVMARKPFKGTVAENVLKYGTGAINIDGCRVTSGDNPMSWSSPRGGIWKTDKNATAKYGENTAGRFPANFIHDGSDEVVELFPNSKGDTFPKARGNSVNTGFASGQETEGGYRSMGDDGSAARFFYCPKANKKDRNEGMPDEIPVFSGRPRREDGSVIYREDNPEEWAAAMQKRSRKDSTALAGAEEKLQGLGGGRMNTHPTVKPTELMAYLCRLVTRPGGVVLDPFMGSGSTGKAAVLNGYEFIGCEMSEEYLSIAKTRIEYAQSPEYKSGTATPKKEAKKEVKKEKKSTEAFSSLESFFN